MWWGCATCNVLVCGAYIHGRYRFISRNNHAKHAQIATHTPAPLFETSIPSKDRRRLQHRPPSVTEQPNMVKLLSTLLATAIALSAVTAADTAQDNAVKHVVKHKHKHPAITSRKQAAPTIPKKKHNVSSAHKTTKKAKAKAKSTTRTTTKTTHVTVKQTTHSSEKQTTATHKTTTTTAHRSSSTRTTTLYTGTPTVVLDYATVVPVSGNAAQGYYKFQNVRFAAPPTGTLRFADPAWPTHEATVNNGSAMADSTTCASQEDCLVCNVWAPAKAFELGAKYPVLVYWFGGGYVANGKGSVNPAGLYNITTDFVYVACNHRLGITGNAVGPSYQHQGGSTNMAVRDAEHAFKWVRKYISNFGGNSSYVTATGFSSGGSQVLFQLTRYAGHAEQLFDQAYVTSPGLTPGAGHHQAEVFWQNVSTAVNCTGGDLTCMRNVPFSTLTKASSSLVTQYGYQMQPRNDGDFLPEMYEAAMYQGQFIFSGPVVITHEQHESNGGQVPGISTESDVINYVHGLFPGISDDAMQQVLTLYPSSNYSTQGFRAADIYQGLHHTAHDLALTHALQNKTFNGYIQIPPAGHGTDQPYYYYNGGTGIDATVAHKMQHYLLSFVMTGDPNAMWKTDSRPFWPRYDTQTSGVQLVVNTNWGNETFKVLPGDDLDNAKTLFWNKALWY
ncbi:hypothetical protein ANO11243_080260 [Dothideomycetidae sp. 11243]|nr:hypothetical protein ANO11243_080260 [fungal sp. No.11243]